MLAEKGIKGSDYLNAYYTYAFADPRAITFTEQGRAFVADPMRLETNLDNCKKLAAYTDEYHKWRFSQANGQTR